MNKRIKQKLLRKQENKQLMDRIAFELLHNALRNNFIFDKKTYKRFLTN
jgi:hypothetical protein